VERRLAAILAADVVGYSRLIRADEEGTLLALRALREELIDLKIKEYRGRIVKLMGDGILVEFNSVVDAVACGTDVQQKLAKRNSATPEARQIVLRIGINLGDVVIDGDDIQGDGVNVAARLEALSEPGGICISDAVHDQVRDRLDISFEDVGKQEVKNIDRPVQAWKWSAPKPDAGLTSDTADSSSLPAEAPTLALPDKPSIAVLPFDNMSGDPEQDYFADGMVEDIITGLSRLKWLFVIARNSSFTYKGKAVDVKQVGRELGVRYVLEGSVRKAGNRVRITGQLIDASTGTHLWADRSDGELEDIFDLQDQVTQNVVGAIAPKLEQAEIERSKRKPTQSLDAYDYYLRGMAAFHQFTKSANKEALTMFSHAFELDADYAAAYGMAARSYAQRKGFGWIVDHEREGAEACRLARKASDIGRDDAVGLAASGFTLIIFGDNNDGDALLERALVLNPNLAWVWHISGLAKALDGRPDEAVERASHALRLSPQDPQIFAMQAIVALGHFHAGRHDEAFSWAEIALRDRSNFLLAAGVAAASAAVSGRPAEAEKAMAQLREIDPTRRLSNLKEWFNFQRPEDSERWAHALQKAGMPE
jgi:TolB-like protein/class 3 adenylate cyclase